MMLVGVEDEEIGTDKGKGMTSDAIKKFRFERGEDKGGAMPRFRERVVLSTEKAIGRVEREVSEG